MLAVREREKYGLPFLFDASLTSNCNEFKSSGGRHYFYLPFLMSILYLTLLWWAESQAYREEFYCRSALLACGNQLHNLCTTSVLGSSAEIVHVTGL